MENLTHWKKTCNTKYLGSWDLANETGFGTLILTIKKVSEEEVIDPVKNLKSIETLCYFQEDYKPMILNTTNKQAIAKATDSNFIENWVGKKIKIVVEKVRAFGDIWDALRISPVVIETTKCDCCGKEIPLNIYNATKSKCGFGVCSIECRDKIIGAKENE